MSLKNDIDRFLITESSRSFRFSVQYSGKFRIFIDFKTKLLRIQKFNHATKIYVTVEKREIENPADFDHSHAAEELVKHLEKDML